MKIELEFIPTGNFRKFLIALAVLLVMGAVFFSTLAFLNQEQEFVRGVRIGDVELSTRTAEQASEDVATAMQAFNREEIVIRTPSGASVQAAPKTIGVTLNATTSIEKARRYGKTEGVLTRLAQQTRALLFGKQIPASINVNATQLATFLRHNMAEIHNPARNASFSYNTETDSFEFIPAESGVVIDTGVLLQKLTERAQALSSAPITIAQQKDEPLVRENGTEEARAEAEAILDNMPYTIVAWDDSWTVEKDDVAQWIAFRPQFSEETQQYRLSATLSVKAIKNYLTPFAPGLSEKPQNAQFSLENGRVSAFQLGEAGYELDITGSAQQIAEDIQNGSRELKLAFDETKPEITNESVDNLGINALLARGTTDFAGSPNSRVHNIGVGADKYHGMLIAPGEEFSFNRNLGPVNAAAGYLPELVIKKDRTVPEYGGGLCQVSTTLFRAATKSGLKITDRTNHSYPVEYYGTPGFDATIYPPNPDFRFVNNTGNHILIQRRIVGTKLAFEIYGKDDGRTVEIDGPHPYDRKPDGSVKAWLKQTVRDKDGNIIEEQTFYSNYRSPNLYPVQRNPLE